MVFTDHPSAWELIKGIYERDSSESRSYLKSSKARCQLKDFLVIDLLRLLTDYFLFTVKQNYRPESRILECFIQSYLLTVNIFMIEDNFKVS